MKEFIEKLIGRLEEKVVNRTFDESIKTKNLAYKEAIEIVNQLAEEYEREHIVDLGNKICDKVDDILRKRNNGWIPCSERLPEPIDDMLQCVIVTDENDWQGMAYYHPQKGWVFAECHNSDRKIDWTEIIAWQPLPEPFKPKGE